MCRQMQWVFAPASKPMAAIMREILRKHPQCEFGRELFPGNFIPILRVSGGKTTADVAEWGYLIQKGKRVYNARGETLLDKPLFGRDFAQGRCVIPVTGFSEWDGEGTGWNFLPMEEELLYLAGVCRKKGEGWEATVVTEHASGCVGEIHHRTPVILSAKELRSWLYEEEQARRFLKEAREPVLLERKKMEGETL